MNECVTRIQPEQRRHDPECAIAHLRADILKVDEPQFKAMFETSAEVLAALAKAFADYERKNEGAWRR